jgi:ketosteroid isomerase-like protein
MSVDQPGQASRRFEALFRDGDLDGLMDLYEENAVFTNARGAFVGLPAIREVLEGYLDSGAELTMNDSVVFEAAELALVHW